MNMTVPLLDLKAQYAAIKDEVDEAIHRVVERQGFVLGPEVEALERRLAEYCRFDSGRSDFRYHSLVLDCSPRVLL